MKRFITRVLASFTGTLLFFMLLMGLLGMLLTKDDLPLPVKDKTILILNLDIPITDRAPTQDWSASLQDALRQQNNERQSLRVVLTAIEKAADDPKITGLFLKGAVAREGYASGWATLNELRRAIAYFKSKGKPVLTWQDTMDEATLYVVSEASHLVMNPLGMLELNGFASEIIYYKAAMEKYGIDVQVTRVGKYKSAVEPYLREHMSPENREQLEALLEEFLQEAIQGIAQSRGLSAETLERVVEGDGMLDAHRAKALGIVDEVGYYDEILQRLRKLTDTKAGKPIKRQKTVHEYYASLTPSKSDAKIAIIYAEGEIIPGDEETEVAGDYIASLLRKAREDDTIKAVVLRVNSPGGSASAAEVIQRETRLLAEQKPFVVSMGTVAASGGYWISAYAHKIYAQPNTITGSIGVFGMFINVKKLINDLGLNAEVVRVGEKADAMSVFRPKTDAELAVMQRFVDFIYAQFIAKVAEGRKLDPEKVHEIAQGRIWSGRAAHSVGLIDELGGLQAAIAEAARQADLEEDYKILEYQKESDLFQALLKDLGLDGEQTHQPFALQTLWQQLQFMLRLQDPNGGYARLPYDVYIH